MRLLNLVAPLRPFASPFCTALLLISFWAQESLAEWSPPTRPPSAFLGVWQGFANGRAEYFRLDIRRQGAASFVMDEDSLGVTAYQIQDWHLQDGRFYTTARSLRKGLETTNQLEVVLRSVGYSSSLMVVDLECSTGWKRQVTLYSQQFWSKAPRRALFAQKTLLLREGRSSSAKRAN